MNIIEVQRVLGMLAPVLDHLTDGQLTDDEKAAIQTAKAVLGMAAVLGLPEDVGRVAALIPWTQLARLFVTWRELEVRAAKLTVVIGDLDVEIEPLG